MNRTPDWIFFIDDSGTREPKDVTVNEFSYGGFLAPTHVAQEMAAKLARWKRKVFDADVELKSNWLRNPTECERRYLQPAQLTKKGLETAIDQLYSWISNQPVLAMGAVVSKSGIKSKYKKQQFYPGAVAYELLLQRITNCAHEKQISQIRIVFDDMTGKTPKGNKWKSLLAMQHKRLLAGKSPFYKNWESRTGMDYGAIYSELAFWDSAKTQCLQIADLIAYNIMRQAREHWGEFDNEPLYKWYRRILPIMHKHPSSARVTRHGAVAFP